MSSCYKRVNFYDLCRLCAQNIHRNKIKIFEQDGIKHQLQAKIKKCLAINVKADDFLPKVVCAKCLKQLELCNAFREECLNSETMLSSYFKNYRHTDEFKKSGKVYIKDIVKSDGEPVQNSNKKPVSEARGLNSTVSAVPSTASPLNTESISQCEISLFKKPIVHSPAHAMQLPYSMDMLNEALKRAVQQLPKEILNKVVVNSNGEVINLAPLDFINDITSSISSKANNKSKEETNKLDFGQTGIIKIDLTLEENADTTKNKFDVMSYCKAAADHVQMQNPTVIFPATQFQSNNFATVPTNTVYHPTIPSSAPTVINVICNNPAELTSVSSTSPSAPSSINMEDLRPSQSYATVKSTKSDIPRSVKTEREETSKGHTCEVCAKSFKRREHLYQHMKLHTGFRPYQCTDCKKTFVRKEHLLRHMVLHSGERNFICDICSKSFSRHDNLLKHIRTHNKDQGNTETAYACDVCQKVYLVKHFYDTHRSELGRCFLAPHIRNTNLSKSLAKKC